MIATNQSTTLLALTNTLSEVSKQLANLTAVQEAPKPHNRIAHLTEPKKEAKTVPRVQVSSIAARLHNPRAAELVKREEAKAIKTPKAAKPNKLVNHMTPEVEADIVLLLTKSTLTVTSIARLYGYTRAAIYGVRDRHNLTAHRASPALMAGIKYAKVHGTKAERAKAKAAKSTEPTSAPETPSLVTATPASETIDSSRGLEQSST